MDKYTQLSQENRYHIQALLDAGHNQSEIARTIGVHRCTVSRELQRNVANTGPPGNDYTAEVVQKLTDRRHADKPTRQDSRGKIKGRTSITERPEVVEQRSRLGNIEVDLLVGKNHKSALLVGTDRTTLLTKLKKVTSRKADPYCQST